jgi:PIN domain nuclease of toxin-antitoxin system
VRLLLDTHVLLWALTDSPHLPARARDLLTDPDNQCWASSASVWEIAIKVALGKLHLSARVADIEEHAEAAGFHTLNVTMSHAAAIETVDVPHGDPFDRLLLAQCEVETLRLLTTDARLLDLPVVVRC